MGCHPPSTLARGAEFHDGVTVISWGRGEVASGWNESSVGPPDVQDDPRELAGETCGRYGRPFWSLMSGPRRPG